MDWTALMRLGFGVLRLSPEAFWSMTPRELAAAADPYEEGPAAPMGRGEFEALRARFPDAERRHG
ncbi:MAG: rcc01693 family protein [Pseudomonadota bacterium]